MARFALENRSDGTWFICKPERTEKPDAFALGMLRTNEIAGLPKPVQTEEGGTPVFSWFLGKSVPLSALFRGPADSALVFRVLEEAAGISLELERYMLPAEGILAQPGMMFADPDTLEVSLIYLPLIGFQNKLTMKKCFQRLIAGGIYRENEDMSYVAGLLNLLNGEEICSPLKIREGIRRLKERQR